MQFKALSVIANILKLKRIHVSEDNGVLAVHTKLSNLEQILRDMNFNNQPKSTFIFIKHDFVLYLRIGVAIQIYDISKAYALWLSIKTVLSGAVTYTRSNAVTYDSTPKTIKSDYKEVQSYLESKGAVLKDQGINHSIYTYDSTTIEVFRIGSEYKLEVKVYASWMG